MSQSDKHRARAEVLAKHMHEIYERLAPKFGWETQKASRRPWDEVPEHNRELMIATMAEGFLPLLDAAFEARYFTVPEGLLPELHEIWRELFGLRSRAP